MSMDPFIAEIEMFAGNFAPEGWAFCDGRILNISDHTALFSLLGTTYGGNGYQTFALPDLRGRAPVSAGRGSGLEEIEVGQTGGEEQVVVGKAGEDQFTVNRQPYLGINFIIALEGIYPSRP